MDYSQKLRQINNRYNPDSSVLVEQRMFSGESAYDKDVARYVMRAMKAVDDEYTKRTKAAGEVVKQHLRESLTNVSYEYQGSVMTDTHIRGASDIDLLVLCEKFVGTDISCAACPPPCIRGRWACGRYAGRQGCRHGLPWGRQR